MSDETVTVSKREWVAMRDLEEAAKMQMRKTGRKAEYLEDALESLQRARKPLDPRDEAVRLCRDLAHYWEENSVLVGDLPDLCRLIKRARRIVEGLQEAKGDE